MEEWMRGYKNEEEEEEEEDYTPFGRHNVG